MAYTETTSTSWFSRLGGAFRGIGFGIALIIAGTALLWWNEGNFVATGDALTEAQALTRELGDISKLDSAKNGQLVHGTGPAETRDILTDPVFGLSVNAIRLERQAEFYQWVEDSRTEKKQKLGGGEETVTTYTYGQRWVNSPVNSEGFRDPNARKVNRNFVLANVENFKTQAANVAFGAYRLPEFLISSISGAGPLNVALPEETMRSLNKQMINAARESGKSLPEPPARELAGEGQVEDDPLMVHVSADTIFLGMSPGVPQTGDVRVTFRETRPGMVSILAKLNGDTFEPYRAGNNKTVSRLAMGTHSLENMYGEAHSSNTTMTWILRLVGTLLVIFGLGKILAPLEVLASLIPFLGNIVGAGTGIVSSLLGLAWSLIIISIAWLRFRPAIGLGMIAVAGALIVFLFFRGRSRKAANAF